MESGAYMENGLRVSVDWLSFTVTEGHYSVADIAELLGYQLSDFSSLEHGGMGYKSALKLKGFPITIFYDGNENMGIHVTISGSAVSEAMRAFSGSLLTPGPFGDYYEKPFDASFLSCWLSKIQSVGKITRLDLAIDDLGENYFSMDELVQIFESGSYVSKFRKWQNLVDRNLGSDQEKTGHTIYLGKRQSALFLRIYDKALEQKTDSLPWVRWELELKEDRAEKAVKQLIDKDNLGSVCMAILSNSLRLIELDNPNKSRCSINPLWQKFIDNVRPLSLYTAPPEKTIARIENWVNRQVAPSLATLLFANDGDITFLTRFIDNGMIRLNKSHLDALDKYAPGWRSIYAEAVPEKINDSTRSF